jgi:DNA helicase HerA-like ATPase
MTVLEDIAAQRVGTVSSVAPSEIVVSLELDAPQGMALSAGIPTRFPRVNGFVTLPTETGSVVALINWIGIEPAPFPKRTGLRDYGVIDLPYPARRMRVTPLGMLRRSPSGAGLEMQRGVLALPSVGDAVLLPREDELSAIVEGDARGPRVRIGRAALAKELDVRVDPDKIFGRHIAVLGNTGSGKSCSVAGLIRWSMEAAESSLDAAHLPNARFLVVDPNGEYAAAFSDFPKARSFQVEGIDDVDHPLRVPAWMWNAEEWSAFSEAASGVQRPLLYQALRAMRFEGDVEEPSQRRLSTQVTGFMALLGQTIALGPAAYAQFPGSKNTGQLLMRIKESLEAQEGLSGDAAIESELVDAKTVIGDLVEERSTTSGTNIYWDPFAEPDLSPVQAALTSLKTLLPEWEPPSGPSEDAPVPFQVSDLVPHMEFLANEAAQVQFVGSLSLRIRTMLNNPRMRNVVAPEDGPNSLKEWLDTYLGEDDQGPVLTILDMSLLPPDLLHVVTAVVTRIVFEATQRYRKTYGSELPTVLVLEEAHHFVHRESGWDSGARDAAVLCRRTIERVAREGRKFGLGLVLSSQRASEVSPTVLSQCNTFLLHRIVNDRDQELVRRLVPDNLAGLLDDLPSLPTQHAILLGWATAAPLLVEMGTLRPEERPRSSDPEFWATWTHATERIVDWATVADDWTTSP